MLRGQGRHSRKAHRTWGVAGVVTPTVLVLYDELFTGYEKQPMTQREYPAVIRMMKSGLWGWLVPGLGHFLIGERRRAVIFFVTISATFWTGVAVGGAGSTIYPKKNTLWFAAQLFVGTETLSAYGLHAYVVRHAPTYNGKLFLGHWSSSEVGLHYTGVAGLLNFLVILDAIARADPNVARQRSSQRRVRERS